MKTIKVHDDCKLKTSKLFAKVKEKYGKGYCYLSNEELDKQFPIPQEAITRYFLDEVEPDKETLGMSCNQADPDMQGITLRERLILDLSTEKKLDVVGLTICSGSRYAGGHVPSVSLDSDGDVCVDWFSAGSCDDADGVRREVSITTLPSNPDEELQQAIDKVKQAGYKVVKEI